MKNSHFGQAIIANCTLRSESCYRKSIICVFQSTQKGFSSSIGDSWQWWVLKYCHHYVDLNIIIYDGFDIKFIHRWRPLYAPIRSFQFNSTLVIISQPIVAPRFEINVRQQYWNSTCTSVLCTSTSTCACSLYIVQISANGYFIMNRRCVRSGGVLKMFLDKIWQLLCDSYPRTTDNRSDWTQWNTFYHNFS